MFILSTDWNSEKNAKAVVIAHQKYNEYLENNKSIIPKSAYEFSTADWHHDFSNHKALHDSWLVSISIEEIQNDNERIVNITLRLLGAYHDGHSIIKYKKVKNYIIGNQKNSGNHGGLNRDEVRLSNDNLVLHEIEWWGQPNWLFECEDIHYNWEVITKDV
jgi:hypothetical protein